MKGQMSGLFKEGSRPGPRDKVALRPTSSSVGACPHPTAIKDPDPSLKLQFPLTNLSSYFHDLLLFYELFDLWLHILLVWHTYLGEGLIATNLWSCRRGHG